MSILSGPHTFTGTNGDPAVPSGWAYSDGNFWQIQDNQLAFTDHWGQQAIWYDGAISEDQWLLFDLAGRDANGHCRAFLNHVDGVDNYAEDGVGLSIDYGGGGTLVVNGNWKNGFSAGTFSPTCTILLEREGTDVRITVDSTLVYDDAHGETIATGGKPGVLVADSFDFINNRFDNMSVGDFAAGATSPYKVKSAGSFVEAVLNQKQSGTFVPIAVP